jgi:hypothetical protein
MRICFSCGSTSAESAFRGERKPTRQRDYCTDCENEPQPQPRAHIVITRASYRARLRRRQQSDQLDLVDAITPCP